MRGVADQRAAQREQVVQVVGGVLGHAQRPAVGEEEVHLGRASVPGVIWNTMRTPSSVSSWPVWVMSSVGGDQRRCVPVEVVMPEAGADLAGRALRRARRRTCSSARRVIAVPA